jgi:hypothetical protein
MGDVDPISRGDKVYLDTAYVCVRWESGGRFLFVEWKEWADSPEYRAAHEAILGAIREHHAARLLIDALHARVISDEDQRWLGAEWIPRAVAAGRRWTAIVMPSSALVKTIVENIDNRAPNTATETRYFDSVTGARAWLSTVG